MWLLDGGGNGLSEQARQATRISENSHFVGRLKKDQEDVNANVFFFADILSGTTISESDVEVATQDAKRPRPGFPF